jgi:hypothetical protein
MENVKEERRLKCRRPGVEQRAGNGDGGRARSCPFGLFTKTNRITSRREARDGGARREGMGKPARRERIVSRAVHRLAHDPEPERDRRPSSESERARSFRARVRSTGTTTQWRRGSSSKCCPGSERDSGGGVRGACTPPRSTSSVTPLAFSRPPEGRPRGGRRRRLVSRRDAGSPLLSPGPCPRPKRNP